MELARAWFAAGTAQTPHEIEELQRSHGTTQGAQWSEGFPEKVTALPERGEGRNHDLLLLGEQNGEPLIACIEAKADEPFGALIGDYYQKARQNTEPTRAPQRIEALLKLVFGDSASPTEKPWCDLRYQLLTGLAGTILEAQARGVSRGLFVVHELRVGQLDEKKLALNADDYSRFIEALFGVPMSRVQSGLFYGAKDYITRNGSDLEILVGKAVRRITP